MGYEEIHRSTLAFCCQPGDLSGNVGSDRRHCFRRFTGVATCPAHFRHRSSHRLSALHSAGLASDCSPPRWRCCFRANCFLGAGSQRGSGDGVCGGPAIGRCQRPAFVAALLLAVSPVWWSQATIAEVYALQGLITLLVVYTLLRWDAADGGERDKWLTLAGLSIGLGLAHHRLTLLLIPAALVFVFWSEPDLIRRPRKWIKPILAALAPLLLYAILPLRAGVGSLDGSYAEIGFWSWVMGGGYSTFLSENPFDIDRTIFDLLRMVVDQYGWLGIIVAVIGLPTWRKMPRQFVFLLLIALTDLLFANWYLVADIEVFLIPLFIIWALFIAVGLAWIWNRIPIPNTQYPSSSLCSSSSGPPTLPSSVSPLRIAVLRQPAPGVSTTMVMICSIASRPMGQWSASWVK